MITRFIDPDIREDIDRFVDGAAERRIEVELRHLDGHSATYPNQLGATATA